jgi:hypothetical protein
MFKQSFGNTTLPVTRPQQASKSRVMSELHSEPPIQSHAIQAGKRKSSVCITGTCSVLKAKDKGSNFDCKITRYNLWYSPSLQLFLFLICQKEFSKNFLDHSWLRASISISLNLATTLYLFTSFGVHLVIGNSVLDCARARAKRHDHLATSHLELVFLH